MLNWFTKSILKSRCQYFMAFCTWEVGFLIQTSTKKHPSDANMIKEKRSVLYCTAYNTFDLTDALHSCLGSTQTRFCLMISFVCFPSSLNLWPFSATIIGWDALFRVSWEEERTSTYFSVCFSNIEMLLPQRGFFCCIISNSNPSIAAYSKVYFWW